MSLGATAKAVHHDARTKELVLLVNPSGNYASPDTLDLTKIANPDKLMNASVGYPGTITEYSVEDTPPGYTGKLIPGATPATWGMKFYTGAGVQLVAGDAYPAAFTANSVSIRLRGPKFRL